MPDSSRIEDLRRRVQQDPASIAFAQLAEEYRRAGQLEESIAICRTGLAIHPGYLSARVTLGRALLELGQLEQAHHELQTVLSSSPDNLAATRGLAEVFHRRGALSDALMHYRRALSFARNDPDLEQTVADLVRKVGSARPRTHDAAAPWETRSADLLTLDQLAKELEERAAAPAPSIPPVAQTAPGKSPREHDREMLFVFQHWLTAIDGYRAERRA
jgi:tetratricopeptide (TPR) repeat protein